MKKITIVLLALVMFSSCARGISVQDAANGKARCGMYLR